MSMTSSYLWRKQKEYRAEKLRRCSIPHLLILHVHVVVQFYSCFPLFQTHYQDYHIPKQRKIKFKPQHTQQPEKLVIAVQWAFSVMNTDHTTYAPPRLRPFKASSPRLGHKSVKLFKTLFESRDLENHTLFSRPYPFRPNKGVAPLLPGV